MFVLLAPILILAVHIGLLVDPPMTEKVVAQTWHSIKLTASDSKSKSTTDFDLTCKTADALKKIEAHKSKVKEVTLSKKGPYQAIMKFHNSKTKKNVDELTIPKSADCLIHQKNNKETTAVSTRDS